MRKLAHIERIIALTSIPGADLIERATVQAWDVVVKKGLYQVDDLVAFAEIDTLILNRPWSAFLFKDTRQLYRLRTIRLRGTLSQGLLIPIAEIPELAGRQWEEGDDLTELLQLNKWEPVLPANLAGQIKGNFPHWLRKTDECRLQSAKRVLDEIRDIPVYVAVKMDGTSFTAYKHEGVFGVCSRNLDMCEDGGDDYWAMAKSIGLPEKLPDGYAIQAELCGPGIQGNKAGLAAKQLFVFSVWDIKEQAFVSFGFLKTFCETYGLEMVPVLPAFVRPDTVDQWLAFADTVKYANGAQAEGIVVRPMVERYSEALRGRLSFKVISNAFLLKTGE